MKRIFVNAAAACLNAAYRVRQREERRDEAVFLSRQADAPSYDFEQIARAFEERGWKTTMHLKKVSARRLPSYLLHVWREIGLLGRCKAFIVDRYDPVVSLIDFDCERTRYANTAVNLDFPAKPVILQIWHAFGAFKKFGFQSNDTPEGHTSEFMQTWRIHRNYSWVACSGENCRSAYAEAFGYPIERIVALDRPERDELAAYRAKHPNAMKHDGASGQNGESPRSGKTLRVLMAPTLRIEESSAHPFKELYDDRGAFEGSVDARVEWAFHPLDSGLPAPGNVSGALLESDVLVTDYSSIAFEAYLLGIPVLFYVPDLDAYRASPGLNADPEKLSPLLCTYRPDELAQKLNQIAHDSSAYDYGELERFACSAFDAPQKASAASRIVDFILSEVRRRPREGADDASRR